MAETWTPPEAEHKDSWQPPESSSWTPPEASAPKISPALMTLGKALGYVQDLGKEAFSGILPIETMQTLFGGSESSLRPEERSKPLIPPSASKEIVGQLPTWAGGETPFAQGAAESISGALSEFSKPSAITQIPTFLVPGVAETYAANVLADLPKQYDKLRETIKIHGLASKETGAVAAESGIQDLMGFLALKGGAMARNVKPTLSETLFPTKPTPEEVITHAQEPNTAPNTVLAVESQPVVEEAKREVQTRDKGNAPSQEITPAISGAPIEQAPIAEVLASEPVSPVAAEVQPVEAAQATLPDWVKEHINAIAEPLEKSGVADQIEQLSAERLTAKEVAARLNIEPDAVRAVRAGRGIPSMDQTTEFDSWLKSREVSSAPSAPLAATEGELPPKATVPDLRSTEEAVAHGESGTADIPALHAKRDQLLAQAEKATGDEKVRLITQAQLYREAVETAQKRPQLLPGEKQGDLISSTQEEPFALVGDKGTDFAAKQSEAERAAQTAEEARLKAEHEQGLLADFAEHQQRGGDELLDAVESGGGLPAISSVRSGTLSGELQNIREEFAKPSGGKRTGADYNKIFKTDAPDIDTLTQHLKAKGFNVGTPDDTINLIRDRLRSGKEMFGSGESSAQALGIVPRPSAFVKQDVAKVLSGTFRGASQIKALFFPANMSEVSGVTARVIRENAAELARKKEMALASLKEASQLLRKNDPATNLDLINKLETGQPVDNAYRPYKAAREAGYDERIKQVQAVNPEALQNLIQDYFPHLWTKESIDRIAGNAQNISPDNPWSRIFGKRPLEGTKAFLKQRSIPTTADGIALGLEPATTNPVMLDLMKMHEMDRYVMGQKIMGELKDRGIAKFVAAGEKADFGHTQIDDRIARVFGPPDWKIVNAAGEQMPGQKVLGHYYAPDDAARVLNNYLSPGLRGFKPYDAFRFVGNMMNQIQLGVSLYHATFTSIDAATSTLALGLEQLARSGGSPKELLIGTGNIAKAFAEAPVGGAMIENLWRGNKFLREYSKPGTTNGELAKIVDAAIAGGARVKMDTFYKTGAVSSFLDAIRSGNYGGAALRAPFALFETAAKPLMEYAVPRMKLGIISQNLEYELSKLPAEATRDDVRKISARVVDSVDNRMGQLIYDNLFWNKTLKDGLMASVRSVGWNLGDIRELGGGVMDAITAPQRAYKSLNGKSAIADNPVITKRMTYAFALPLMVGVLGSMYQYLMTGEGPKDLKDVYMPRTGRMKPDGTPERVMLPTYMKDVAPLVLAATREGAVGVIKRSYQMGVNKLHPALTAIAQMLQNKDYYGNQIRNESDGFMETLKKETEFVAKQFRPFSVQGVTQREGGLKEKAQAVVGLMPAPRELTDTPAMRMIHNINLSKRPEGGYTAEQQQKRDERRRAQQGEDLRPELFKRLSKEEKAKVLEVATPEERDIFESGTSPKQFSIRRRQ